MSNIVSFPTSAPIEAVEPTVSHIDAIIADMEKCKETYTSVFVLTVDEEGIMGIRTTLTTPEDLLWNLEKFKTWLLRGGLD